METNFCKCEKPLVRMDTKEYCGLGGKNIKAMIRDMTAEEIALLIREKFQREYPNKPVHKTMLEIKGMIKDYAEAYHQAKLKEEDETCERCHGYTQIEAGGNIVDCYMCNGTGEKAN